MMGTIRRNQNSVKTYLALITIIAVFCLAYPSTAEAAVEVDAVSSNSTIGTSITIPHTTSGTNRLMLVGVSFNNNGLETVTEVTYNSVALTLVGTAANDDDSRIEIWRLIAPDTGIHDVVVTFSADLLQEGFAGVVTFTGVHQTTPLGTFASAAADGITATVDVSSATGELVFDVLAAEYPSSATVGTGQTQRWNIVLSNSIGAGSTEPGAATVTMSWTLTAAGDHWAIGAVPVKPATTTIGDGTSPANKNVAPSSTNNAVDAFTLATDSGTDTITALTVTFTGTDVNDVAASGVKIYEDDGGTANEWDATDTLIDTTSFSGSTASFTGLNISVDTSATQYVVTYDIAAGATASNTLQGAITAATVTNTLVNNDTTNATLTISGNCSYSYRKPITFDNTKVSGTADLTNFPVLISLSGNWLKTTTADPVNGRIESASGYDIIFKDSTGTTQLDHEIELYDGSASGGTLVAWVKIPTLDYNDDTIIYMCYGSSCPSSSTENITGVWDSNYVAVWHFKEASGTVYDSTSNNNDGTPQGTPSYVDAKIGKAYNTTNGYFSVPYSSSLDFVSGSMFIECWVKYDDFTGGTDPGIFVWATGDYDMFGMNDPTTPRFRINSSTLETGTASADTWYYYVGRYTGSNMYTYHNTSQLGSLSKSGNTAFANGTNTIGYRSEYLSSIDGIIDELRISKVDRGVDYMTTTHNNQNSPSTFYTVGSEDYCDYSSWRQITIDNTKVSGTADLSNFPLLVSLSGDWLKTTTADPVNGRIESASGYDIIFKDTSGAQLDHEIEEYDGTNGTLVAWVRIPTLSYNTDTVIYMYYGSSCVSSSQENITGVWDSNYKAVWHLKEDPSGTPPQINDSTSNNNDGTTGGTMISGNQVAGKMSGSVDFDGTDDYATMPTTGFSTSAGTVEAWINIDSFDPATCEYIFSHCQESPTSDRVYIQLWNDNTWGTGMGDTFDLVRGSTLGIDTWYHLAITWDGTNVRGYLNGGLDFGPTLYTGLNTVRDIFIMAWNTPMQWADGTLDELRISSTARITDWIQTEYNNQNSPATFYTVGSEDYCDYSSWRQITIDNTKVSGTADLSNFPLLVSLSGDWLKTTTADPTNGRIENASGYDIIFKDTSGTQLDHEIEEYDGTNGTFVAWVRIPTISYNINTVIYMYYGNTCISSSQENASGVWDSNYAGVWHMKEDATDVGTSNLYQDSTANANHGDDYISATGQGGKIDGGQQFDGIDDYVNCGNDSSLDVNYITIEFWLNVNTWVSDAGILSKGTSSARRYWIWTYGGAVSFEIDEGTNQNSAWTPTAGQWEHLALIYNGTNVITYRNGAQENSYLQSTGTIDATTEPLLFGDIPPYNHCDASIDEVRISNVVRSIDWIKTSFNNQNTPSTFYSVGAEGAGCSYSHRKQITILNSQVSGTADLSNFPVLVSLTDTNLRHINSGGHVTNSNGYDIVFRASDETTQLDHEIEKYDGTTGTVVAWVRIPTLSYNTDTVIYMYYGNTCISTSQENATGVWDSNFVGVWHLHDDFENSTSNNNDGTDYGSSTATGQIGDGRDFENTEDDYIDCGNDSSLDLTEVITISAWIKPESQPTGDYYDFVTKDNMYNLQFESSALRPRLACKVPGGSWNGVNSPDAIDTTKFYNVAATYDKNGGTNNMKIFIDGELKNQNTYTDFIESTTNPLTIGRWTASRDYDGAIDEVRISNTARSADWIKTSFNNQNTPSSFYNEGSEESAGTVTLGNHTAGQETDNFGAQTSITGAELFAFKLTNTTDSTVTVKKVLFPLSAVTGIVQGDFTNVLLCVDDDNDGNIEAGETTTVGGSGTVNAGITDITFSTDFTISANTTVNYIVTADMSNLESNDTVTIDLGTSNVTITAGHVGGSAPTSATHTSDAACEYSSWRQITIDNTKVSGTSDHTDFPLLVSLSGDWLKTTSADPTNGRITNSNGYDIIFKDTSGTQLDYEIEEYDGTNGTLIAWVRIPTLSYDVDTVIYIYYGNSCISTSQENVTGVWDSDYKMVQHMIDATSSTIVDSTSNNIEGTKGSADNPDEIEGRISKAQDFDTDIEYIQFEDHSLFTWTPVDEPRTLTFWFKATSLPTSAEYFHFLQSETDAVGNHYQWIYGTDDVDYYLVCRISDNNWDNLGAFYIIWEPTLNTWYHVSMVASSAGNNKIYIDGVSQSVSEIDGWDDNSAIDPETPAIKANGGESSGQGVIDEFRYSHAVRSADWIKTSFDNQNSPSTFYIVGNEGTGCSYSHKRKITIQASEVIGTSDHSNFPALVNLTHDSLRHIDSGGHVTNSSGHDIIFRASDETTQLDHEIEDYDGTNGTVVAWVRIPTLSYNTDTVIYMYYGNTCISSSQENITGVWDSNYKAVWHLKEDPSGTAPQMLDSTSNDNDGTSSGSMTSGDLVDAKIGKGLDFDYSDDVIEITGSNGGGHVLDFTGGPFTISAWFNSTTLGGSLINKRDDVNDQYQFFTRTDGQIATRANVELGVGNTSTSTGTWHYGAVVVDSSENPELFLNGSQETWVDVDGSRPHSYIHRDVNVSIGARFAGYPTTGYPFGGFIDEVRISNIARSADWISTSCNNQNTPSTFYNEGSEESAGTVTLGNHTAGQETDNFGAQTSISGAELFAFKLTNTTDSTVTVKKVLFPLSAVTGILQGDFDNLYIYIDTDHDGEIEVGETTTVGGTGTVNTGVTDIIFSTNFTISANTTVNYIVTADMSSLEGNDTVTIDLNPENVTITAGHVTGTAPTSATHTSDSQCKFLYRRPITIQASQVSGPPDLTDFPVVVSLSGTWLRTSTADETNGHIESDYGYDIIFRDSSGTTQLDHEIEDYDGSEYGGTLVAWVRIPTLKYNENTVIYMYYGNPCIDSSTENITGVWDSNFVGVWHLKEEQSGSIANDLYQDSTSNNNDGDDRTDATAQNGKINGGQQFGGDANGDSVEIPHHSTLNLTGDMTISYWFHATENSLVFNRIVDKGYTTSYYFGGGDGTNDLTFYLNNVEVFDTADNTFTINAWHHAAVTYDSTSKDATLILDGTESGSGTYTGASFTGNTNTVYISYSSLDYDFAGYIDEVRISNTDRTVDWLKTEHNNQNDPATFYNVENEETPAPTAVDLIFFTATGQDENVIVEWETAQEVDNLGFNLYRSTELDGTYSKLNRRLIPGLLSSVTGQQYTYVDRDVTRSVLYYYMLEDLDLDGTRTMHGPICVDWDGDGTPDDFIEEPDDDTDTDTGEEDPEVSIPDTTFDELESDLSDWTPSNIGGSASWVKLASFKAYEQDDGVALEWETSYEIDNLGFHIYREIDGKFYRITPDLVPGSVFSVGEGSELLAGQSYAYWDALSQQTGREFYWLDSIELNGGRASFGPIEPEISGKPIPKGHQARFKSIADYQVSKAQARGKIKALREELSAAPIREQKSRAIFYEVVPDNNPSEPRLPPSEEQWALSAQPGVKIYVKEDGWYRVGEPELVAAGLMPGIDPRYLQLYADGVEQSILVTGDEDGRFDPSDAVEFYGTALDTPFTDAHIYWLVVGSRPGRRLDTPFTDIRIGPDKGMRVPRGLRGRGGTLSFPYTVELKERTFYFAALKSGERDNFFGSVISTDPVNQLLTLPNRAPSSPRGAMLEVGLQGATDVYHQVRILLNYRDAYDVGFTGQLGGRVEIPISQGSLLEGDNVVALIAQGGSMDISLVDHVRITYWRTYTADDDVLQFKASGGEWLSIGGFSSPGIRVVDITDSVRMLNVRGKVKSDGSGYAITIKVPGGGERTLLAFTEEKIKSPAGIAANIASSWHELSRGADVIIIGHSDLLESVRLLKKLREQQGMAVVLVDVEDLYDEFNFGAKSPWAMKDFLAQAFQYWNPQPRYLILVGDTSYDPRNYLGYGEFDLMPTKFVDTEKLKTASDDWFVDFDDDELPEMAVGRLPAASAAEVTAVVTKIINYEGYAGLMNEVLFVSDTNDFFDFEQASAKVAELIPENLSVNEIFRGRTATARTDLLDLLNQGQLLVNYFGHGSIKIWNGNLLTYADVWSLTNSPNLPFFVSTTCLNGFFQDPYSESLAEGLLKAPLGGAVAVWTSSGLTDPEEQVPLNEELITLLFNGEGLTIGEAVMRAKQAVSDSDIRRTWILFGDPTLRLR